MASAPKQKMTTRKILRQGDFYVCGMCGRKHSDKKEAEVCLRNCFASAQQGEGVAKAREKKATKFRCGFCKRVYKSRDEAKACVDKCKFLAKKKQAGSKTSEKKIKDQQSTRLKQLLGMEEAAKKKFKEKGSLISQRGSSYICNACHVTYASEKDALECANRHVHKKSKSSHSQRVAEAQKKAVLKRRAQEQSLAKNKVRAKELVASGQKPKTVHVSEADMYSKQSETSYKCQKCGTIHSSHRAVVQCYQTHFPANQVVVKKKKPAEPIGKQVIKKPSSEPRVVSPELAREKAIGLGELEDDDKYIQEGSAYFCRACYKSHPNSGSAISCFNTHLDTPGEAGDAEVDEQEEQDEGPQYVLADDAHIPDKKKFLRRGAKYECRKCHREYYMRMEVVECFNYDCPEELPSKAS